MCVCVYPYIYIYIYIYTLSHPGAPKFCRKAYESPSSSARAPEGLVSFSRENGCSTPKTQ